MPCSMRCKRPSFRQVIDIAGMTERESVGFSNTNTREQDASPYNADRHRGR